MLPPLPARKSYNDVPRDSLAYALFLNPLMEVDPINNNNDEPPALKTLTARLKHMPGKHNQSAHGKPGRAGTAFRGAYSAARASGASHVEARNQAKTAAEQVREQMRAERREQLTANPKPKRTAPPRADTPTTPTPKATAPIEQIGTLRAKIQSDLAVLDSIDPSARNGELAQSYQRRIQAAQNEIRQIDDTARRQGEAVGDYSHHEQRRAQVEQDLQKTEANLRDVKSEIAKLDAEISKADPRAGGRYDPQADDRRQGLLKYKQELVAKQRGIEIDESSHRSTLSTLSRDATRPTLGSNENYRLRSEANMAKARLEYGKTRGNDGKMRKLTPDERAAAERDIVNTQKRLDEYERRATTPTTPTTPKVKTPAEQAATQIGDYPVPKLGTTYDQHDLALTQHRGAIMRIVDFGGKLTSEQQATVDKIDREKKRIEQKLRRGDVGSNDQMRGPTKAEREAQAERSRAAGREAKANTPTELLQRTSANLQRILDSGIDPKTKKRLTKAQRELYTYMLSQDRAELARRGTTKADDSVGGVPRKYGARAGEVITGNLGRDTGGKFARVGSNEGAIVRAAINRGFTSAGSGKRGTKRAAVSDAQKRRQQADTGASSMDTLGFDAGDYDFIAGDKPQDASDPQFARLIEQGLMDDIDGQAYPSALGRKIAAAAGAGDIDKAQELLARDRAKRTERQAKTDAQIQAYDDIISDETASPRARAIAARKRTILIGKSDTSMKAADSYTPPAGVQAQAKRGLALRSEFGRGGTSVGIARARDLSNGKSVSRDTIMRMVSFFARHAVDKRPGWSDPSRPSNGYIAHLLWGGDAGRTWANSIAKRIKANE